MSTDLKPHQLESFDYDDLDRLKSISINNNVDDQNNTAVTKQITYYKDGGFKLRDDVGNYYYDDNADGTGDLLFPNHAVKKIVNQYGTPFKESTQTLNYTSFNSVATIIDGNNKSIFKYGFDKQRRKMDYYLNNSIRYSKYYSGGCEKTLWTDESWKIVTYISGGDGVVAQIVDSSDNSEHTYYVHTDHLGSVVALTEVVNNEVVVQADFSYDAWGRMRNPDNWTNYTLSTNSITYFRLAGRGYTGHEHLMEFDLLNANGRLYDPTLGQFMQPDNYVQMPESAQSYNRYAYCLNNPLKYTDPSGEFVAEAIMIGSIIYSAVQGANSVYHAYNWGGLGSAITAMHAGAMSTGLSFALGSIFNGIGTELLGSGMEGWQGNAFNIGTSPIKSFLSSTIMSGGNSKYDLSQFGLDLLYAAGWAAVGLAASAIDNAYFNDVANNTAANGVNGEILLNGRGSSALDKYNGNIEETTIRNEMTSSFRESLWDQGTFDSNEHCEGGGYVKGLFDDNFSVIPSSLFQLPAKPSCETNFFGNTTINVFLTNEEVLSRYSVPIDWSDNSKYQIVATYHGHDTHPNSQFPNTHDLGTFTSPTSGYGSSIRYHLTFIKTVPQTVYLWDNNANGFMGRGYTFTKDEWLR